MFHEFSMAGVTTEDLCMMLSDVVNKRDMDTWLDLNYKSNEDGSEACITFKLNGAFRTKEFSKHLSELMTELGAFMTPS